MDVSRESVAQHTMPYTPDDHRCERTAVQYKAHHREMMITDSADTSTSTSVEYVEYSTTVVPKKLDISHVTR